MQVSVLADVIFKEPSKSISGHEAIERAKFEGWAKVELVRILRRYFKRVVPEEEGIDIVADD